MFDVVTTVYETGLGVAIPILICIIIALSSVIFAVLDYRIALMIATLFYAGYFIMLYEADDSMFYMPLMLTLLAVVILILSLIVVPKNNYVGLY